jgi:predicted peroxiredoxin
MTPSTQSSNMVAFASRRKAAFVMACAAKCMDDDQRRVLCNRAAYFNALAAGLVTA